MTDLILVVEDEPEIRELLVFTLARAGFETLEAGSAEQALQLIAEKTPQLAIVDWMMPGMSGVDLAHRLRQDEYFSALPIVMLTARGEEEDKLRSFASGVDDYVTKPFSPRELVARIRALLRRTDQTSETALDCAGIRVDQRKHSISIADQELQLGPTEFKLLAFLLSHPDRVFDRSQLLDRVWGRSADVEERTVDVHILRLRKLLKPFDKAHYLETVRGFGYRFNSHEPG